LEEIEHAEKKKRVYRKRKIGKIKGKLGIKGYFLGGEGS
jgi:hypothetical protein